MAIEGLQEVLAIQVTQSWAVVAATVLKVDSHCFERKTAMEGFTLAIKCVSLELTHFTSFHNSLAITSHMEPSNHKEARKGKPPMCSEGESQKENHSYVLPSMPACPCSPCFSKCCSLCLEPSPSHFTSVTTTHPRVSA